jgi:hypothetical protein
MMSFKFPRSKLEITLGDLREEVKRGATVGRRKLGFGCPLAGI